MSAGSFKILSWAVIFGLEIHMISDWGGWQEAAMFLEKGIAPAI